MSHQNEAKRGLLIIIVIIIIIIKKNRIAFYQTRKYDGGLGISALEKKSFVTFAFTTHKMETKVFKINVDAAEFYTQATERSL